MSELSCPPPSVLGYPDQALSLLDRRSPRRRSLGIPESIAYAMLKLPVLPGHWRCAECQEQAEQLIALATEQGYPYFLAEGKLYQAWALGAARTGR